MTKKERVLAAIQNEPVDYIPSGFSLHFDPAIHGKAEEIAAHLAFFKETDTDILKIMNENLVPDFGPIQSPSDWACVSGFTRNSAFIQNQLELTKRILESADPDAYHLGTLHGIVASSIHPIEHRYGYIPVRELLCSHLRNHKTALQDAMKRIAEALCFLAQGYAQTGVNGIYFASLGAEARFFTDEEFATWVAPLDKQIMQAAKEAGVQVFLHACKDHLVMERYQSYMPFTDVINWGAQENPNYPLHIGKTLFAGTTLMGGLSNLPGSALNCGTPQQIESEVKAVLHEMGSQGLILGADCTLPPETPYENFKIAAHAAKT